MLLPLALVSSENLVPATSRGWLVLADLAFAHAAGQGLVAWALAHLPAAFGAASLLWQPVAAAVFTERAALVHAGIGTARNAVLAREVT